MCDEFLSDFTPNNYNGFSLIIRMPFDALRSIILMKSSVSTFSSRPHAFGITPKNTASNTFPYIFFSVTLAQIWILTDFCFVHLMVCFLCC